jgi:hypothetical protein
MAGVTGGDLYHLWRVSEVHLPRVADVYYDANRLVAGGAGGNDEGGFRDNQSVYPGSSAMTSSVGAAWAMVRDEMQAMFAQIGETVLTAADGVRMATQAFIDSDETGSNELAKYLSDPNNHNPNDPASNPPLPGADDSPGAPILPE